MEMMRTMQGRAQLRARPRVFCDSCISVWYADVPLEDLRKVCPACLGIYNCRVCLHGDNLIKVISYAILKCKKLRGHLEDGKQKARHDLMNGSKFSLFLESWKPISKKCYSFRKSGPSICGKSHDSESPYYQPLNPCVGGTRSRRWIPIEDQTHWPSRANMNSTELDIYGTC